MVQQRIQCICLSILPLSPASFPLGDSVSSKGKTTKCEQTVCKLHQSSLNRDWSQSQWRTERFYTQTKRKANCNHRHCRLWSWKRRSSMEDEAILRVSPKCYDRLVLLTLKLLPPCGYRTQSMREVGTTSQQSIRFEIGVERTMNKLLLVVWPWKGGYSTTLMQRKQAVMVMVMMEARRARPKTNTLVDPQWHDGHVVACSELQKEYSTPLQLCAEKSRKAQYAAQVTPSIHEAVRQLWDGV